MSILGRDLKKALNIFSKHDAHYHLFMDSINFNIVGSKDGITSFPLLDFSSFTDKEVDVLGEIGFQYDGDNKSWYLALSKLKA